MKTLGVMYECVKDTKSLLYPSGIMHPCKDLKHYMDYYNNPCNALDPCMGALYLTGIVSS